MWRGGGRGGPGRVGICGEGGGVGGGERTARAEMECRWESR